MSNQRPINKGYSYMNVETLKKAMEIPAAIKKDEKYGDQLKVQVAEWEGGKKTLSVWDAEKKESHKLGVLFMDRNNGISNNSTVMSNNIPNNNTQDDFPF